VRECKTLQIITKNGHSLGSPLCSKHQKMQLPSFPLAEERVVERSDDRVSRCVVYALALMSAGSTHPDYASLVDPLFACGGKRVRNIF